MTDLDEARRAESEAAVAYEMALDMRQAVPNDDRLAVAVWHTDVAAKATAWAHAQQRRMRLEQPDWETLLRDPTMQFDKDSVILRSIAQYQNAKPGTMNPAPKPDSHLSDPPSVSRTDRQAGAR